MFIPFEMQPRKKGLIYSKEDDKLTSQPTTIPSSGRARAAARLLAPVKTPMSSTCESSIAILLHAARYKS